MNDDDARLFAEVLRDGAAQVGVPLPEERIDACRRYASLMLATNEHTNLTRIVAPAEVAVKHFVDSLTVLLAVPDLAEGARIADVGTGAGFPGLALKIARPDLRVTLLDSLGKRLTFLGEVVAELGLKDVALVHARAEDAGRAPAHRDAYDLVTARAVAALPTLLEWCGPLVRVGGRFVAMKSAAADEELAAGANAARVLHLRPAGARHNLALTLPAVPAVPGGGGDEPPAARRLLTYEKTAPTPKPYPRRPAEIKAKPL